MIIKELWLVCVLRRLICLKILGMCLERDRINVKCIASCSLFSRIWTFRITQLSMRLEVGTWNLAPHSTPPGTIQKE